MRAPPAFLSAALLILLAGACERTRDAAPTDTSGAAPMLPPDTAALPPVRASAWDRTAGALLVLSGPNPGDAIVLLPELTDSTLADTVRFDPSLADGVALDLFARSGFISTDTIATMAPHSWTTGCIDWPAAALRRARAGWTVGFPAGRVTALPLDSIEGMSRADSSALAASLARAGSNLPDDPSSRLRGLPFRVRAAWRFTRPDGGQAVVADLLRRLTLEASPMEEHTLLVAERDSAGHDWRVVYHDRRAGAEESVEAIEVLAGVRMADGRPALVLARSGDETTRYMLLERIAPGRWAVRWQSVTTGC